MTEICGVTRVSLLDQLPSDVNETESYMEESLALDSGNSVFRSRRSLIPHGYQYLYEQWNITTEHPGLLHQWNASEDVLKRLVLFNASHETLNQVEARIANGEHFCFDVIFLVGAIRLAKTVLSFVR